MVSSLVSLANLYDTLVSNVQPFHTYYRLHPWLDKLLVLVDVTLCSCHISVGCHWIICVHGNATFLVVSQHQQILGH